MYHARSARVKTTALRASRLVLWQGDFPQPRGDLTQPLDETLAALCLSTARPGLWLVRTVGIPLISRSIGSHWNDELC